MLTGLLVRRHAIYTQCVKTLWILKDLGVVQPGTMDRKNVPDLHA